MAKAKGDLCDGISVEVLVPKWTCHLLIIVHSIDASFKTTTDLVHLVEKPEEWHTEGVMVP